MSEPIATFRILLRGGAATLWPWIILAISFTVNLAIYAAGDLPPEARQTGGILSLFATAIFATQQMWSRILPFTIGQSGTRRGFVAGMGLFVLAQSLLAGLLLSALGTVERATNGWGVDMTFFRAWILGPMGFGQRLALFAVLFLVVSAVGGLAGAVLVRWGAAGGWALFIGAMVAGGALLVGLTWRNAWGSLITLWGETPWVEVWVAYPLAIAACCALAAWGIVRRAVVT